MSFLSLAAIGLLAISGLLLDAHRRSWRAALEASHQSDQDRRAARALYLRRMQASSLIGFLGLLLMVWPVIPEKPLWFLAYLLGLVVLCGWMLVLALIDAFAARIGLRKSRQSMEDRQKDLESEFGNNDP